MNDCSGVLVKPVRHRHSEALALALEFYDDKGMRLGAVTIDADHVPAFVKGVLRAAAVVSGPESLIEAFNEPDLSH